MISKIDLGDSQPIDLTIENLCKYVAPKVWNKPVLLQWPPDVFAMAALLLLKSGAYCYAVSGWRRKPSLKEWLARTTDIAQKWRHKPKQPDSQIQHWHQMLIASENRSVHVSKIPDRDDLRDALLNLCAVADEACLGVGFAAVSESKVDAFLGEASQRLFLSARTDGISTLCKHVHHSIVRVLPKLHTPQSGITIRSLTHHLALCPAGDVKAKWIERRRRESSRRQCLNLLLAPWPRKASPAHFRRVDTRKALLRDMPKDFGFFEYKPPSNIDDSPNSLKRLLKQARQVVKEIDGVVFPELALTKNQYEAISTYLMNEKIFLICGVREARKNYFQFDIPSDTLTRWTPQHKQDKHHRWRLDHRQIVQYGLGSCLDVERYWWEHISIKNRQLYFVVLDEWLTVCALICEDLARQDPVAELVRAVGPNLVIALLMDGPQLPTRWPARYATVLADDPGSSVLTLTSLGMCELSRPPLIGERSRAIALWKDAKNAEAVKIELPPDADGVVLSISCESENEWTADGREDKESTKYPTLSGIQFVSSSKKSSH